MKLSNTPCNTHHDGLITMAIVMFAFYVLNWLSPEYHDDFVYKFMVVGGSVDYSHPISSIRDIFVSQIDHYFTVNGRSIVHFLVQLFTGLLGKQVFNVLNVLVFAAFVWLMRRNLTRQSGIGINGFALAVVLVLTLMLPRIKDTFLWMTGSVNYLWSATGVLLLLLIYERRRQQVVDKSLFWLLPLAFLLGWTHEGITLPLGISLVYFSLLDNKTSLHRQGLWMALFFLGGACMSALAPGTIARSGASGGLSASTMGLKVITGITVLGKLKVIYLAMLLTIVARLKDRGIVKSVISSNDHLLLAALLSCGIVFLSGLNSTRTAFGLELFAMIYLLRLIGSFVKQCHPLILRYCSIALAIGLVAFYALLLRHTIPSWQESQRLITQITQSRGGIIGTHEHPAGIFSSYVCTMLSPDSTVNAVNYNPKSWPASIAATYHCDSLVFLPQVFLDDLKNHSGKYEQLDLNTPLEFFAQRIDDDEVIEEVQYQLSPPDYSILPFFFRPIARKMKSYNNTSVSTNKWATVTLYSQRYLLIKRDHDYDDRLLDIKITSKNKDQEPNNE